ncbi:hypothetical protein LSH36_2779g00001 [Paralvinella palmiformis]|uniref:Uncharacterized protein n=1 Tax=Paralvinella palmiformis TaxID=53620 RepID=A0AAD9IQ10_9ANNE|nr:hypothetical protein LSH36_2779g00001 [Paralvinella palmiformis]
MNVPEFSMLTMYPPANIYAVVHDRHYIETDHETYTLEHLQITSILDEQIRIIEPETWGQSTKKHWREKKKLCVFTEGNMGEYIQPHKQHTLSS